MSIVYYRNISRVIIWQYFAARVRLHLKDILKEKLLLGVVDVTLDHLVNPVLELPSVVGPKLYPQHLDQWIREEFSSLLQAVFVENFVVVCPDVSCVATHYNFRRWHELLPANDLVRFHEHQHG